MLNFLVSDICQLTQKDMFKYIVQFENAVEAEVWFLENDFNTERFPYYKDSLEAIAVDENVAEMLIQFAKDNHINKFFLVESDAGYRSLCFTGEGRNKFVAERIQFSKGEVFEITEVEPSFVFGFTNVPSKN